VRQAVSQFRDPTLRRKVAETQQEAIELVEEEAQQAVSEELQALETIKAEAAEIYDRYRPRLEDLAAQLDADLEPLDRRVQTTQQARS
jgi:molecular chaperone GrpE (heat shock protein)